MKFAHNLSLSRVVSEIYNVVHKSSIVRCIAKVHSESDIYVYSAFIVAIKYVRIEVVASSLSKME